MAHDRAATTPGSREPRSTWSRRRARAVPSGALVIDEGLLLEAVSVVNEAGRRARAHNVRRELGKIADDGGYFDVMDVADDLAELESLGKLKRAPAFDWGGVESMPKTRIQYELPGEQ
jgi:hypothetical protein